MHRAACWRPRPPKTPVQIYPSRRDLPHVEGPSDRVLAMPFLGDQLLTVWRQRSSMSLLPCPQTPHPEHPKPRRSSPQPLQTEELSCFIEWVLVESHCTLVCWLAEYHPCNHCFSAKKIIVPRTWRYWNTVLLSYDSRPRRARDL